MSNFYQKLKEEIKAVSDLRKASILLAWDTDVMMPPLALKERSEIASTLAMTIHNKATSVKIKDLIDGAEQEVQTDWDKRNLQLIKESYRLSVQVPEKLVQRVEICRNNTGKIWQQSKDKSDWNAVVPALEELFSAIKEQSNILADVLGRSDYDAQLYLYARGNKQENIDPLFSMLKKEMPSLVQEIVEKQKSQTIPKTFSLPVDEQAGIVRSIIEKIGYDFNRGRLDVAMHPASYGTHGDGRITTSYIEDDLFNAVMSAIHETGHSLYTWNSPDEWDGQPVGGENDMSLHESQSLIMERHIGLSEEFIDYMCRVISKNSSLTSLNSKEVVLHLRHVKPDFIRIQADEVTYPLHIVLRYEIEKALFEGDLKIADIPGVWNEKMQEYFGLEVKEHRLGCLQDIHWYEGLFGYFPAYTQGALFAAQLFKTAEMQIDGLQQQVKSGDLAAFNHFLRENVHSQGQLYDAPDLIERATGQKPNTQYFLDHLRNRYL